MNKTLTSKQIELIEETWDFVLVNTAEAGMLFYDRLFQLDPSLRHLFKGDIRSQSQKLVSLITFAVHKLNNLHEIETDVKQLGERHVRYEVKPEHYATVGSALLWTLEKGLGNGWNSEVREAWATLYGILSGIMIKATAQHLPVSR